MPIRYFAYGSNMVLDQMAARCPDAVFLGTARVADHAFRIAAAGYGTILPHSGGQVLGVLWELTLADESALDRYEDLASGLYHKTQVTVTTADGGPSAAMVYVATDPAPGRPRPGYLEAVIVAAQAQGFPAAYIADLAG